MTPLALDVLSSSAPTPSLIRFLTSTRAILRLGLAALLLTSGLSAAAAEHTPRAIPVKAGGPDVTFTATEVVASNAAPGATLYFASLSLGGERYTLEVEKASGTSVAGADGTARFTPPSPLRLRSIWVVVDSAGGYTIASPPGMLLREVDFPADVLQHAATDGSVSQLTVGRFAVDLFVIRPASGIWAAALRDGDATDVDHSEDGTLTAEVGQVPSVLTGQPTLDRIQPGDVVFVVDRNSFQFFAARIPN